MLKTTILWRYTMERDPVCGMLLAQAQALELEYHGKPYYFCSWDCKHQFEENPDEFAVPQHAWLIDEVITERLKTLAPGLEGLPMGH